MSDFLTTFSEPGRGKRECKPFVGYSYVCRSGNRKGTRIPEKARRSGDLGAFGPRPKVGDRGGFRVGSVRLSDDSAAAGEV